MTTDLPHYVRYEAVIYLTSPSTQETSVVSLGSMEDVHRLGFDGIERVLKEHIKYLESEMGLYDWRVMTDREEREYLNPLD